MEIVCQDDDKKESNYDELKDFILMETETTQALSACNKRTIHEENPTPDPSAFRFISVSSITCILILALSIVSAPVLSTSAIYPASVSVDPIIELIRKFSQVSQFL